MYKSKQNQKNRTKKSATKKTTWSERRRRHTHKNQTKRKCSKSFWTELHAKKYNKYANEHVNIVVHETVKIADVLEKLKLRTKWRMKWTIKKKNKVNTHIDSQVCSAFTHVCVRHSVFSADPVRKTRISISKKRNVKKKSNRTMRTFTATRTHHFATSAVLFLFFFSVDRWSISNQASSIGVTFYGSGFWSLLLLMLLLLYDFPPSLSLSLTHIHTRTHKLVHLDFLLRWNCMCVCVLCFFM